MILLVLALIFLVAAEADTIPFIYDDHTTYGIQLDKGPTPPVDIIKKVSNNTFIVTREGTNVCSGYFLRDKLVTASHCLHITAKSFTILYKDESYIIKVTYRSVKNDTVIGTSLEKIPNRPKGLKSTSTVLVGEPIMIVGGTVPATKFVLPGVITKIVTEPMWVWQYGCIFVNAIVIGGFSGSPLVDARGNVLGTVVGYGTPGFTCATPIKEISGGLL